MFTDPVKNLKTLGLLDDHIVVDFGAGTGHYSLIAGELVPRGKVYAVEINKDFLGTIKNKVSEAGLNNVEIIWGNVEKIGGSKIADKIADAVIISNILFQVEDKDKLIQEAKKILKHKGKVLLIDWSPDSHIMGPKRAIHKDKSLEMFESAGFSLEREINAGEHHYGMILVKV